MRKMILAALLAACPGPLRAADPPKTAFALVKEATAAYQRGDKAAFLKGYEEAARLRPGDAWILYNLACAQAVNGQTDAAVASLERFGALRVVTDLESDKDLDAIRQTGGYEGSSPRPRRFARSASARDRASRSRSRKRKSRPRAWRTTPSRRRSSSRACARARSSGSGRTGRSPTSSPRARGCAARSAWASIRSGARCGSRARPSADERRARGRSAEERALRVRPRLGQAAARARASRDAEPAVLRRPRGGRRWPGLRQRRPHAAHLRARPGQGARRVPRDRRDAGHARGSR